MKTSDRRAATPAVLLVLLVVAVMALMASAGVARGQDDGPSDPTTEELAASINAAESELDRVRADARRELDRLATGRNGAISTAEAQATDAIRSVEGSISNEVRAAQATATKRIGELESARSEVNAALDELNSTVKVIDISTKQTTADLADSRQRLKEATGREVIASRELTARRDTLSASAVAAYLAGNSTAIQSTFDIDEFTEARRAVLYSEQLLDDRIVAVADADDVRATAVADRDAAITDETAAIDLIDQLAFELRTAAQQIQSAKAERDQLSADIDSATRDRDRTVAALRKELADTRAQILSDLAATRNTINRQHDSSTGTVSQELTRQIGTRSEQLSAQRQELGQRRLAVELAALEAERAAARRPDTADVRAEAAIGSSSGVTTVDRTSQATSRAPAGAGSSALASAANRELLDESGNVTAPAVVAGQQTFSSATTRVTTTTVRAPVLSNKPAAPTIAALGFPSVSLNAFERAANAHPRCGLRWQVLAGISKVESNHGRIFGSSVAADGTTTKLILGPVLDGSRGFLAIPDSDGGRLDRDTVWDRAVGPMQFIPTSWKIYGADADRNGQSDPHDVDDAAMAAANLLCSWGPGLEHEAALRAAVLHYNRSVVYGNEVIGWALAYERVRPGPEPVLLSRVVAPTTTTTATTTTSTSVPVTIPVEVVTTTTTPSTTSDDNPTSDPSTTSTTDPPTTSTTAAPGTSQGSTTSTTRQPADRLPFLDTTPTTTSTLPSTTTTTEPRRTTTTRVTTTSSGPAPSIVIVEPIGPG